MSFFKRSKASVGNSVEVTYSVYSPINANAPWQQIGHINNPPAIQRAKGYPGLQLKNGLESYTSKLFVPVTAYGNTITTWQPTRTYQGSVQLNARYPTGGGPVTVLNMKQTTGIINGKVYGRQNIINAATLSAQVTGGLPND